MSEFEIVQMYKEAKNKNKQIGIISDLAQMTKQQIVDILTKHGAISGIKKPAGQKNKAAAKKEKTVWTKELTDELTKLHGEGLNNEEISERMGLDKLCIDNKIFRLGLKRNPVKTDIDAVYIKTLENELVQAKEEIQTLKEQAHETLNTAEFEDISLLVRAAAQITENTLCRELLTRADNIARCAVIKECV